MISKIGQSRLRHQGRDPKEIRSYRVSEAFIFLQRSANPLQGSKKQITLEEMAAQDY